MIEVVGEALNWISAKMQRIAIARNGGQGLVEYALILLLMAVAIVGSVSAFGGAVVGLFDKINATFTF
jgi:pilus assembly protein Flp/PilA